MREAGSTGPHIFLTGFMAAGKTTVGRVLAEHLGWTFIDLDRAIEERLGTSIPEIFARQGEEAFRRQETLSLGLLAQDQPAVVATGGGIVGRDENRLLMQRLGRVVFLDLPWEELLPRLQAQGGRPLATGVQGWDSVQRLYDARRPFYLQADLRIDCRGLSPLEVAMAIAKKLNFCPEDGA
ncbi:shikimate kinase [Geoalkalibacter halelectricus]|uniref:Shikimate kinase n=1 Tax=Geoalkalibacter halelectricus TaxID=2847045 RepID=A0ABY5ZQ34_9BACT|nr:shikimate kinase [Geoalkalibacter halelectricus]MDO3376764.1 shikimate kinase [Geoalkalibacter halelectricus]UWZ81285.1 shikimate kinase [Geoalkalibacter halelectricus]